MVIGRKITYYKEWEVEDYYSYTHYRRNFYSPKTNKPLFTVALDFKKDENGILSHNFTYFGGFKALKLTDDEVSDLIDSTEQFVREYYYKLYDPTASTEETNPRIWEIDEGIVTTYYLKNFYSRNYKDIILKVKVAFFKYPDTLSYLSTEIYSCIIFKLTQSIVQRMLNDAEKFAKNVYYKYYERME